MVDGEKIMSLHGKDISITLVLSGPFVLKVRTVLSLAREKKLFFENGTRWASET